MNYIPPAKKGNGSPERQKLMVSNTRITVKPEHRREFFQTFATVSDSIRREDGCVSFRLFEETGHENSVILVGEWESKEAFHRHSRGQNYAVLHGSVQTLAIGARTDHRLLELLED